MERDGGEGRWRLRGEGGGEGDRGLKVEVGRERALEATADATGETGRGPKAKGRRRWRLQRERVSEDGGEGARQQRQVLKKASGSGGADARQQRSAMGARMRDNSDLRWGRGCATKLCELFVVQDPY